MKASVPLLMEAVKSKERRLTSSSAIAKYLLKQFVMNSNIAAVDPNVQNLKQGSLTGTDYAQ